MAKRSKEDSKKFVPGVIYELGINNPDWQPFYVGESHDATVRINGHISATKRSQTDVYKHTRELDSTGIKWELKIVEKYGEEGPKEKEHERIIHLLRQQCVLKNMKKGNQRWMEQQIQIAKEMNELKLPTYESYKQYKIELSTAERKAQQEAKHAKWLVDEANAKHKRLLKNADRLRSEEITNQYNQQIAKQKDDNSISRARRAKFNADLRGCKQSKDSVAQRWFDEGKYYIALMQLGGSRTRFEDEFGISFDEAKRI